MNFLICLYLLLIAPKIFWDRVSKGKRHPAFSQRIGFKIPDRDERDLIWIHAVSVGEVKAVDPLFKALKEKYPHSFFLITTTSQTGNSEAKRSLKEADCFAYLPIDLSFVVNRWVKKLSPKLFILVESDFWPNLLKSLKKHGTKIVLVNGKVSLRSFKRLKIFSFFARRIFSYFDLICVQNDLYFERFSLFLKNKDPLAITGNLKLDQLPKKLDPDFLDIKRPLIVVSCTHEGEEEMILDALQNGNWHLCIAPRHPERFKTVKELLERKKIPFSTFSSGKIEGDVLLIDQMGVLALFYKRASLAILGGSYIDKIGGHNILEPCLYGTPVVFGPYMFGQLELKDLAITASCGKCIEIEDLRAFVVKYLESDELQSSMRKKALDLMKNLRGATKKTIEKIAFEKSSCE